MNLSEAQITDIIEKGFTLIPPATARVMARAIIAADLDPRNRLSFYEYLDRSAAVKEPA